MNRRAKSILILAVVIAAIIGLFWFARFLGSGEKVQSEKPLVICQPQNAPPQNQKCFWTTHIHATVKVFMKGIEVPLGFEEGVLEGSHTHAEPNKIHWHGLIPVDPKTKEVKDWSALEVQKLIPPRETKPKFIVNGQEVKTSYIWKDGDTIEIRYE